MIEIARRIQLVTDKIIVISYVVFVVALAIVYPARTIDTVTSQYAFDVCAGEWGNAAGAEQMPDVLPENSFDFGKIAASSTVWKSGNTSVECSALSVQNAPNNIVSGAIHVSGFVSRLSDAASSSISVAGIEEVVEILPVEVVPVPELVLEPLPEPVQIEIASSTTPEIVAEEIIAATTTSPVDNAAPETPILPVAPHVAVTQGFIDVQYLFEGGEWKSAGVIENFTETNFNFPLSFDGSAVQSLQTLRVRLVGLSETNQESYYVDSIWVSTESSSGDAGAIEKPSIQQIPVSEKGAMPAFDGVVIENPAISIPEPEPVIVDPAAKHACEFADYHVRLGSAVGAQTSVDVFLSGLSAAASSTIHAARIPEGLSFAFENGLDELGLVENQISAKMSIAVTQEIEPRSFNVPIVYSMIRPDLVKSSSLCHLNVIVE